MRALASVIAALLLVLFGVFGFSAQRRLAPESEYQVVVLGNGSAFFGRMEQSETDAPVLRDVFFIQSKVDPETRAVENSLTRRSADWHMPDYMVLNREHIVLVEPVGPNSRVAELMRAALSDPRPE